jgi:hypothetical protein
MVFINNMTMKKLLIYLLSLFLTIGLSGQKIGILAASAGECTQNLLKWSEVIDPTSNDAWSGTGISIVQNQAVDLAGNTTLEQITTSGTGYYLEYVDWYSGASHYITVIPGVTYYVSFDCTRGTMTNLKWSVYDQINDNNIISPTSYYSQTSTTVHRVSLQFTAPAGCTLAHLYPIYDSGVTGTVFIGRMQVESNGSCYIQTTTSIITP